MQLHTWMDASLRDLTDLVKQTSESARQHFIRLSFAVVYPDKRGALVLKEVGSVHALRRGPDDEKTLRQLHFQPGDYLDVAVIG